MLTLTRKEGQEIFIYPFEGLSPETTIAELFGEGPVRLIVDDISGSQVRVSIKAPDDLIIMRKEIVEIDIS